mgnify:CR=1 FL=1
MGFQAVFSGKKGRFFRSLVALGSVFLASALPAQAAKLTTFEEYGRMTKEQRSKVTTYAMGKVWEQAVYQKDEPRKRCIRENYMLEHGDRKTVSLAYARLRGRLDASVDNPNPNGRVEYLVAIHLNEVCAPSVERKAQR